MQQWEKPAFLSQDQAAAFHQPDVARSYRNRPDYPQAAFAALERLMPASGPILDIGCGTGFIARPLAQRGHWVDAVDIAASMIEEARTLPGGDLANLRWMVAPFEEVALTERYALIVAGESLHWMDWPQVLPKCRKLLAPGARLALVEHRLSPPPWHRELGALIARYSTNQHYRPFDTAGELVARGRFREEGRVRTAPEPFVQSIENYVDSFHGRAALSRQHMGGTSALFDAELRSLIAQAGASDVTTERSCEIVWGVPESVPDA